MPKKIAIIGAGPIGLHAALAAQARGFEAAIYERGEIADSVKRWGHIRMFSPFSMNLSSSGLDLVRGLGRRLPAEDACLTGAEYAAAYLEPLSQHLHVLTHASVKAVVRATACKTDMIGEPSRAGTRFRLLVEHHGIECYHDADIIFDCSGTFRDPNPLGDGGIPALGESNSRDRIRYGLGESADVRPIAGRRVLVAGQGHSAANLIDALVALKKRHPKTEIHWVIRRSGRGPCSRVPNDPLAERDRICAAANEAAESGVVIPHEGCTVLELKKTHGGLEVTLQNGSNAEVICVDQAIAATGFRPDWSFVRELQLQTCWATEGTYPLAASLLGGTVGNCLAVPAFGAETLLHPEPDFYALGMKSYGRTPNFIIATGLRQIESIMQRLGSE